VYPVALPPALPALFLVEPSAGLFLGRPLVLHPSWIATLESANDCTKGYPQDHWCTGAAVLPRSHALTTGIARYSQKDRGECREMFIGEGVDVATSSAVTAGGMTIWFDLLAVESDTTVSASPWEQDCIEVR